MANNKNSDPNNGIDRDKEKGLREDYANYIASIKDPQEKERAIRKIQRMDIMYDEIVKLYTMERKNKGKQRGRKQIWRRYNNTPRCFKTT